MEGEIDELVAKFCGVTTANPEQAQFFLESTEWQLEPALQLFFDSDGGPQTRATAMSLEDYDLTEDESMGIGEPESQAPGALLQESALDSPGWEPIPPAAMLAAVPAPDPPPRLSGSFGNGRRSRGFVTTLGDLGKHHDPDSDSEGQEYYTGGEKSGMVVQDPAKKHGHRDVEALFERVRSLGAQEGRPVAEAPAASNRFFSGSSNTLTGESRQPASSEPESAGSPPTAIVHTVHFWRNGFTVNEGPLRRLDDVSNLPFLESINRSECPRELEPTDRNIPVNVNLVKRITEDWQAPPEPKYVPFKGLGHTVGTNPASSEAVASSMITSDAPRSSQALIIDDARPATSIQLRLSDGTRMVARFNTTHTVADIRGFIDAARPGGSGPYQLQTMGFPPVKLTNPTQTIEGAGLLNAVVIQKG